MPVPVLRAELFKRYRLDWELGLPPETGACGGRGDMDLSRFFATGAAPECDPGGQSK
jgi:hypothetical protein